LQGEADCVIERQRARWIGLAPGRSQLLTDRGLEIRPVTSPTTERRAAVLVGDGRPQILSTLALSAHRRQSRAEPDAEHASGAITDLLGEHEALTCLHLCFVDAAAL
jgi:hypothetical protein